MGIGVTPPCSARPLPRSRRGMQRPRSFRFLDLYLGPDLRRQPTQPASHLCLPHRRYFVGQEPVNTLTRRNARTSRILGRKSAEVRTGGRGRSSFVPRRRTRAHAGAPGAHAHTCATMSATRLGLRQVRRGGTQAQNLRGDMRQPGGTPPRIAARQLALELHKLYEDSTTRTYESLAKKLDYNRKSVTAILRGERLPPTKDFISLLVKVCVAEPELAEGRMAHLNSLWEAAKAEQRSGQNLSFPSVTLGENGFEKSWLSATWYGNNCEFYSAAKEYVDTTRERIRVTYVRQTPPTRVTSREAEEYFAAILEWARQPGPHEVTRIIGVPISDGRPVAPFLEWMQRHHDMTADIHNYEARVMKWSNRGDGLNMALFDKDVSFLAVSGQGGGQNLSGLSVTDPRFTEYLIAHFDQLWHTMEPLGSFLESAALP